MKTQPKLLMIILPDEKKIKHKNFGAVLAYKKEHVRKLRKIYTQTRVNTLPCPNCGENFIIKTGLTL